MSKLKQAGIRLLIWDFDQTILCGFHSRGRLSLEDAEKALTKVSPLFKTLVPHLIREGFHMGVATFSDARMASTSSKELAGESLVRYFLDATLGMEAGSKFHVVSAFPVLHRMTVRAECAQHKCFCLDVAGNHACACKRMHPEMAEGKHWHIHRIMEAINFQTGEKLQKGQVVLFDDDTTNVMIAQDEGFHAVAVNRKQGFNEESWLESVGVVCAKASPTRRSEDEQKQ